jgi:hypothetical protein
MKEQALIDEQIKSIQDHPGNISSNLGDNLPFKEKLEDIVNNTASIHSEFNVALHGICNVIKKINTFVHQMDSRRIHSKKIKGANPETQYYPNSHIIAKHDMRSNPQVKDLKNVMGNIQKGIAVKPVVNVAVKRATLIKKVVKTSKRAAKPAKKLAKAQAQKAAAKPKKEENADKKLAGEIKKEIVKTEKPEKKEAKKESKKEAKKEEMKKAKKEAKKGKKARESEETEVDEDEEGENMIELKENRKEHHRKRSNNDLY